MSPLILEGSNESPDVNENRKNSHRHRGSSIPNGFLIIYKFSRYNRDIFICESQKIKKKTKTS
jgi:hypothetical protein